MPCRIVPKNENIQHFGYPETKITDYKISGTRLETTLRYCRLILETETEPGTKSHFHYLCLEGTLSQKLHSLATTHTIWVDSATHTVKSKSEKNNNMVRICLTVEKRAKIMPDAIVETAHHTLLTQNPNPPSLTQQGFQKWATSCCCIVFHNYHILKLIN